MADDYETPEVVMHDAPEVQRTPDYPIVIVPEGYGASSRAEDVNPIIQSPFFEAEDKKSRDLPRRNVWLAVTFGVLIVIIATIGGVLGGLLSKGGVSSEEKTKADKISMPSTSVPSSTMPYTSTTTSTSLRSTSTTTPTSIRPTSTATTPTTTAFPTSGLLSLDCPAINGTLEAQNVSSNRYIFEIYCGFDCSGSQGDSDQSFNEFTIDECMNRCATMNAGDGLSSCGGVVWNGNLTSALEQGGNCYLKLGTVTLSSCDGGCPVAAAAKLVGTGEN